MEYAKIMKNYTIDPDTGCWNWKGATAGSKGYGQVRFGPDGKQYPVHRLMTELYLDKLKPYEVVHHKCNNPKCINPEHLVIYETSAIHLREAHSHGNSNSNNKTNKASFRCPKELYEKIIWLKGELGLSLTDTILFLLEQALHNLGY